MKRKFFGTFAELQAHIEQAGLQGTWQAEPNGVYMLRMDCGVNMHWASTTKTVWFDGPIKAQRRLAAKLGHALTLPPSNDGGARLLKG